METYGKPLWILSTGADVNQASWITQFGAYLKTVPVTGWMYFDYGMFQLQSGSLPAFRNIL
jgi:hypothetical protein